MDFRTPAVATKRTRSRIVARSFAFAASAARPVQTFVARSYGDSTSSARQALRAESYGDAVASARRRIVAPSYADGISSATPGTGLPVYTTGYAKRRLVVAPATAGAGTLASFPLPIALAADLATTNGARAVANDGTALSTDLAAARAVYGLVASWDRTARGRWYVHHDRPTAAETATAAAVWAGHAAMLRCGAAPADVTALRTATASGGPTASSIGVWPAGLFDGVDDINKLPSVAAWNGSAALTVACLVQAAAANPTGGIWVTATDPAAGSRFGLRAQAGKLIVRIDTSAGTLSVQTAAVVLPDTSPHHVAVVWEATKRPIVYVDGVKRDTTDLNTAGLAGTTATIQGDFWVGVGVDPAGNGRFSGRIGEVAVSLSARSAAWIAATAAAFVDPVSLYGTGADDAASEASSAASPVAVPVVLSAAASASVAATLSALIENPAGGALTYALVGSPSSGTATLAVALLTVTTPAGYTRLTGQYRITAAGGKQSTGTYIVALPSTGWWDVVKLRKTLTYRRFRAGPDMWGGSAANFQGQVGAPPEACSAQTCPDPTGSNRHDWVHVCGGPIHKESLNDLNDLSDHQTGQPYQGFLTTGSIAASYNSIKAAYPGDEDKLFWIPMLYAQPNATALGYTETIGGNERSKIEIWQLIAANGTVPGTAFTTDDVYWTLGRRCALACTAKGVSKDKLVIRWNKEGNRACPWGAPFDLDQAARFTSFVDAWTRILAAFDRGFGYPAAHYYGYARSGNTGTPCAPGGDPLLIDRGRIWKAMECSWHPAKEVTQGGANAKINGETDAQLKARVKLRYDEIIAGIGQGFGYQQFVDYCGDNQIPFVVSESDPSKTTGSPCWVPDWAMEWLLDTYNSWQDQLAAKGTCLITAMFDTANLSSTWFWDAGEQTTMRNAGAASLGLPQWYPGYTATTPIPASNWADIKTEFQRRHALAVATFKTKWGT